MQKNVLKLLLIAIFQITLMHVVLSQDDPKIDIRVDNMGYWKSLAAKGLVPVAPNVPPPPAEYQSSYLSAPGILAASSVDIPVTDSSSTQSENSIFVNPNNVANPLNSNNSATNPFSGFHGSSYFYSTDQGRNWNGSELGAGGNNWGDPAAVIGNSGRQFIGFIGTGGGQGVSYSDDGGVTWTPVTVATSDTYFLDKNHLWIDNAPGSSHDGNLYDAWTSFGSGPLDGQIMLSRSLDNGVSWSTPVSISDAVTAGSHNQGVNIQTGPYGEVYAVWAIYDSFPSDETAIGFAKSTDGGASFGSAQRIISNIRGIRSTRTNKDMRVNSFPSMAVDLSGGPNNGHVYVVWTNIGVPGINLGNDKDVYLIKSTDAGASWSAPGKVNQDASGLGKEHYFPWITCDPVTGNLHVIFYDNRNVADPQTEVFVANSFDGGTTWSDFRVSDVSFTPTPIPGLASGYFGDYLGIAAREGIVYPVWTDNRTGSAMTYCSPFIVGCLNDMVVLNEYVGSGFLVSYQANNTITLAGAGNSYLVDGDGATGGTAIFVAGKSVKFRKGFRAKAGSSVTAMLDDCIRAPFTASSEATARTEENTRDALADREQLTFLVSPNPSRGKFNIAFSKSLEDEKVAFGIFDLMGKVISATATGNSDKEVTIKMDGHSKGVYLLKVFNKQGLVATKRILVE